MKGGFIMRWGRGMLEPETYERTLLAAEADLRHELANAPSDVERARISRHARMTLLRVLVGALAHDRRVARRGLAWWLLAAPLLAVLVGMLALPAGHGVPVVAQLVFVALGLLLGATMARTPRRVLAHEAPAGGWIALAVLALVPLVGTSVDGATRWLAIGPLQIHVATLVLPFVALALVELSARGRALHTAAMIVVAHAALALTSDAGATLTWSLVLAVATSLRWRWALAAGALGIGAFALALARDPGLAPSPLAEGALGTLAGESAIALALGIAGLALAIGAPLTRLGTADRRARALAFTAALVVAAPLAANAWLATPVPLVGYGGSAVIATYLALGALLSYARRAPPRPA